MFTSPCEKRKERDALNFWKYGRVCKGNKWFKKEPGDYDGCFTERWLTKGRITERRMTEGQITKGRITERKITEQRKNWTSKVTQGRIMKWRWNNLFTQQCSDRSNIQRYDNMEKLIKPQSMLRAGDPKSKAVFTGAPYEDSWLPFGIHTAWLHGYIRTGLRLDDGG